VEWATKKVEVLFDIVLQPIDDTPTAAPVAVTTKAGSLKMNTALEYSTRVVQEGGRQCKKSTLNDLVNLTPLRIPLMNPPQVEYRYGRVLQGGVVRGIPPTHLQCEF
jgi:hypothetical protein